MVTKIQTAQIKPFTESQDSSRRVYVLALLVFAALVAAGICYWRMQNPSPITAIQTAPVEFDDYLVKLQKDPQFILDSEDFSSLPIHKAIIEGKSFELNDLDEITKVSPNYGLTILHCAVLAGNSNALTQLLKFQESCEKNLLIALMQHADRFGTPPLFYHMASPHRKTTDGAFIEICQNTLTWTECLLAQRLSDGRSPLHFVSDLEGVELPDMSQFFMRDDEEYERLQWQAMRARWPNHPHPLHYAIKKERIDVIKWLRKMGCPSSVTSDGKSALAFAGNNQAIIDALKHF